MMDGMSDLSQDPRVVELHREFAAAREAGDGEAMVEVDRRLGRLIAEITRAEIEAQGREVVDGLRGSPDRNRKDI